MRILHAGDAPDQLPVHVPFDIDRQIRCVLHRAAQVQNFLIRHPYQGNANVKQISYAEVVENVVVHFP